MNIFESKWRELLEDLIINHKKHVKDETQIREIIGVHEIIDNPYIDSMLNINHKQFAEAVKRGAFDIKDYKITYPVAFDMGFVDNDTARIEGVSRADKTKITKAFLDTIAAAGYKTLLYGNKEWLIKEIDLSKLSAYDVWLSQMEDVPDYPYRFTMWQYANDVTIDGIAGYANMNISFIDYSEK